VELCLRIRNDRLFALRCFEAAPHGGHRALFMAMFGDPTSPDPWPPAPNPWTRNDD
jgi:hypothetical protein